MMHEAKGMLAVGSTRLGLDVLVGFAGLASLVASIVALFVIAPGVSPAGASPVAIRAVCALALAAASLVVGLAAHAIVLHRCRALAVAALAGIAFAGAALLAPSLPERLALLAYAATAVGTAALASLWFCFVCMHPHKSTPLFVSSAVAAGLAICLVEGSLLVEAARIAVVLVLAVSVACMLVLAKAKPEGVLPEPVGNRESDKRSKILKTSALMLSISNFEFGFVASTASSDFERAACLASAAMAALVLAVSFARKGLVNERSLSPLTPPLTIGAFLSAYLFGEALRVPSLCVLSALCTVYLSFGIAAVAEHVRLSHLSAPRAHGKARALDYLGMAVGFMVGYIVAVAAASDTVLAAQMTAAIAVAYSFIAAFCHKARFPEEGMEGGLGAPEAKGLWKKRCRVVGEQCDLSERQFEVLMLVAQGRNAKYIEQALSISLSTAQTHIRNIYRKTGVHSRQELLDLIEGTKLYGEE